VLFAKNKNIAINPALFKIYKEAVLGSQRTWRQTLSALPCEAVKDD